MASEVGAKGDEDDERHPLSVRQNAQVLDPHHDVIFLKGERVGGDQIVISQISLCGFELDHGIKSIVINIFQKLLNN